MASEADAPPAVELRRSVNDELAISTVDEEPYPDTYTDHQIIQRQTIPYERGQSNLPVRVLFESFRLDEILDG
ncbi:hypothetical protein [Nocardiopsis valliformis]|uniref:hypothetical protein n=1 Tax=Nocardiopsis valliformis TaxID=239974 RepID=UPI0003453DD8|nr:hypothetical protein [Nocardiopsis valliformis]